jgi:polyisoprenyl-phosphate glycosyltransferase
VLALVVLVAKTTGAIDVPGYAATVLTIIFFAALNSFGLGIIGSYTWRAYENTKGRPQAIVLHAKSYGRGDSTAHLDKTAPTAEVVNR